MRVRLRDMLSILACSRECDGGGGVAGTAVCNKSAVDSGDAAATLAKGAADADGDDNCAADGRGRTAVSITHIQYFTHAFLFFI